MSADFIPIIDLGPFIDGSDKASVVAKVRDACINVGFLIVTNHGIPKDVIDDVWSISREFFDLPESVKREVPRTPDYPYGYIGIGDEKNAKKPGDTGPEMPGDLKESFQVCIGSDNPAPDMIPPRFPTTPSTFEAKWRAYYKAVNGLANTLLRIFALALDLPENWFEDKTDKHISALRCLNYPHPTVAPLEGQLRCGAHTDYGTLTILRQDDAPGGLQVLNKAGEFVDVSTRGMDAYIINLGDLMEHWTNDLWVSTVHRVKNPPFDQGDTRRQSLAFFHNLNADAVCETFPSCITPERPLKYEPINSSKWLFDKFAAANY